MGDLRRNPLGAGRSAAVVAALTLSGCATGMTAADCAGADWRAFGEADGLAGHKEKYFDRRAEDCRNHGFPVNESAYFAGRDTGLQSYCTEDGGFAAGKAGEDYDGVCPISAEPVFLKGFDLGAELFTLAQKAADAHEAYDSAMKDLDQHRFLMHAAEKRAASPTLGREERESARQDAEYRAGEIARLETEMPKLLAESDAAEKALAAWRDKLIALGKTP